jgi:hypothetical protein
MAVAHENVAVDALFLEHGASATSIGAGRWVLSPVHVFSVSGQRLT